MPPAAASPLSIGARRDTIGGALRIAIYENLPPGGAKRASFGFGRHLASRHRLHLYRLSTTDNRLFDLAPYASQVYVYPFRPLGGLLDGRLHAGHYAPRSYTLFRPLRSVHRRIAADMRGRGYDLVLAHTDAMTQSPYLLRWLDKVTNVYYCHEILRVRHEREAQAEHRRELSASGFPVGALRVLEDRLVLPRLAAADATTTAAAQTIVVNSRYTRERVRAVYGRDAIICQPGVDVEAFSPDPVSTRRREVLSIGSPPLRKGHLLVIEALSCIPADRRPALRVLMAGPSDARRLERLASARGVQLIIEWGLDEAALVERYRAALATICAARLEPFGLTSLESMACGTPVIAIDEAGYRESVEDGVTGRLVEPRAEQLARAIDALVGDPQGARMMGEAGRARAVEQWSWAHAGRRLESELQRLSSESG
jgi:glycosyltransferase involved in cell wall biosynthesis